MDLQLLRTFLAVAEMGNLTRAAERLHLSQPAVSGHVKALEQAFAVRLFDRTPSGMSLTTAGATLRAQAERVIAASEELRRLASNLRGDVAGRLRLGTVSDPRVIRIGDFLSTALRLYPQLELELHNAVSGAAQEGIRHGSLDASFFFGDVVDPRVSGMHLRSLTYRVVAPADWKERVLDADWEAITRLPWILTPAISTHNQLVRALFSEHEVEPLKLVEADQESVIADLVAAGVGVSLMREDLAQAARKSGLICIWPQARLCTALWFIHLAERLDDPLIGALRRVVAEVWGVPATEPRGPTQR